MASKKLSAKANVRRPQASNARALATPPHCLTDRNASWSIAALFLLHGTALTMLFLPLQGIFNEAPLIDQDWGLHFHHLRSLEAIWHENRRLWGYNPYFMAGYPSNTIQDVSIKFFELVSLGLGSITATPIQWFKITAGLAMASVPVIMYATGRNCFFNHGKKNQIALGSALLGTAYWWNSLPREMYFYGMIGFPIAAYVSVWGMSAFYRLVMESPKPGLTHVGWLCFAAAILPLHVQSIIIFAPAMIALLMAQKKKITLDLLYWMVAALALCAAINFTWLLPAFQHRHDDVSSAIVKQLPLFASTDSLTFLIDYLGPKGYWTFRPSFIEKGFRLALLILGVLGISRSMQNNNRPVGIMLTTGLCVLFLLTYFGAFIPAVAAWQPLRFKVPLNLFLVVAAAYCINEWLSGRDKILSPLVPAIIVIGGLAFAINIAQTESTGRLQLRTRMAPEITAIVDWIQQETPREGRLLFEESGDETGFVYDGIYLSSFLPYLTGRQLIGGPINLYNDRHAFAEFHSGKLFKRDIGSLSDDELRNYLRLYNIGAVVAFHPTSIRKLLSIPGLVTVDRHIGPIYLMKVNQPLSWFIAGQGHVTAGANRLELRDLKGREIVIKFHWVESLSTEPDVTLVPTLLADDPIPFIKLIDPPPSVVLRIQ